MSMHRYIEDRHSRCYFDVLQSFIMSYDSSSLMSVDRSSSIRYAIDLNDQTGYTMQIYSGLNRYRRH